MANEINIKNGLIIDGLQPSEFVKTDANSIIISMPASSINLSDFNNDLGAGPSLWTGTTGGNIYRNSDVGIGDFSTVEPSEALEVQGKVLVSGQDAEFIGDLRGAVRFKAKAAEALSKGDVVYISGISGNTPEVSKADANDASKMPAFGLAFNAATLNGEVDIVTFGTLNGLNTSVPGWSLGDTLYVSTTAGEITNSAPTGETSLIQNIGKIQRLDSTQGSIKVGGAGRSNATPNLNRGSLFVGNSANQSSTLAIGANGTFLKSDGSDASWSTVNEYGGLTIGDSITSGTANTTLRENSSNQLATGTLLDNGNTIAIGTLNSSSSLNIEDTLSNGIRVINTKTDGLAKGALFSAQGTNTGNNVGISVSAFNSSAENIGALITAAGGTGTYSLQLSDGTETVGGGKFLKDTGEGKANWADITESDITDLGTYALVGSYTNNYVTKWNATTNTLEESLIRDDGNNVAIGAVPNAARALYVETSSDIYAIAGQNASTSGLVVGTQGVSVNPSSTEVSYGVAGSAGSGSITKPSTISAGDLVGISGSAYDSSTAGKLIGALGSVQSNSTASGDAYGVYSYVSANTAIDAYAIGIRLNSNANPTHNLGIIEEANIGFYSDTDFVMIDAGGVFNFSNINNLIADSTPDSSADYVMTWDDSVSAHKKVLVSNLITVSDVSGAVSATGGVDNRVAVFNAADTIEGDANFTWDGSKLSVNKPVNISNSGSELINLNKTGEKIVYFRDAAGTTIDASMGTKTVATSADTFFINKGTTVALEIDNGHNIDIPNGNLNVNGTITSTSASDAKLKLYTASGANNNRIEYLTSAGATRSYIGYAGASSFLYYHNTDSVEIRGGNMLLNSTGTVTIESGGSNAIVANSNQNVSIPNGTLTVNDSITTNHESVPSGIPALGTTASLFSILRTSSGTPLFGLLSNIDGLTGNTWLQAQRVDTATALDLLLNPKGGNVGIGLGSVDPTTELHVKGSGEILRLDTSSATGNNFMAFYKGTTQMGYLGYSSSANNNMTLLNDTASGELQFWTTSATNVTAKAMGIDSNGNVDISDGTLNITAAADQLLTLDADNSNYIRYRNNAGTTNRAYMGFSSAGNFNIYNQDSSKIGLYTNSTLGLEVETTGNVTFDKSITIKGGTPAAGKYLKSTNATGLATWSTISSTEITGIQGTANQVAYFSGTDIISGDTDFLFDGSRVSIGEAIDTNRTLNVKGSLNTTGLFDNTSTTGNSIAVSGYHTGAKTTGESFGGSFRSSLASGTANAFGLRASVGAGTNVVPTSGADYAAHINVDGANGRAAYGIAINNDNSNTLNNYGLYIDTQNPGTGRAYGIYENGSGAINLFNSNVVIGKDVNTVDRNYALYVAADAVDNSAAVGTYTGGYDEYNINRSTGGSTDYEPSAIIASRNITSLATGDFSFISMITGETGGGNNSVGIIGVQASLDGLSNHETDMIFGVRGTGASTSSSSASNRAHIQEGIRIIHGVSGQYTGGTVDGQIDPTTVTPPRVRFGGSLGYTFPAKDGTNGDVLTTDGNGTVSWGSGGTGSGGGLTPTYQTGTTYTASAGDLVVAANAALVITLPTAAAGAIVGVKSVVAPTTMQVKSAASAQTIDGQNRSATGESINNQWDYIEFVAYTPDGGTSYDWLIR